MTLIRSLHSSPQKMTIRGYFHSNFHHPGSQVMNLSPQLRNLILYFLQSHILQPCTRLTLCYMPFLTIPSKSCQPIQISFKELESLMGLEFIWDDKIEGTCLDSEESLSNPTNVGVWYTGQEPFFSFATNVPWRR